MKLYDKEDVFIISLIITIIIIIIVLALAFSLQSCRSIKTFTGEDIIAPTIVIEDKKVTCLQEFLKKQTIFKSEFRYDNSYPPTIYVYMSTDWNTLNDDSKDLALRAIGWQWYKCNPDSSGPVTVIVYNSNEMPIKAVFVNKQ